MKMVGRLRKISVSDRDLLIDRYVAAAVGLRNGCLLYCVAFRHRSQDPEGQEKTEANSTRASSGDNIKRVRGASAGPDSDQKRDPTLSYTPYLSIFGSPLSPYAWRHLVRIDMLISPMPGSIVKALKEFSKVGLLVRVFDSADGIDVRNVEILNENRPGARPGPSRMMARDSDLAFLTVMVEVPPWRQGEANIVCAMRQISESGTTFNAALRENVGRQIESLLNYTTTPPSEARTGDKKQPSNPPDATQTREANDAIRTKVLRIIAANGLQLLAEEAFTRGDPRGPKQRSEPPTSSFDHGVAPPIVPTASTSSDIERDNEAGEIPSDTPSFNAPSSEETGEEYAPRSRKEVYRKRLHESRSCLALSLDAWRVHLWSKDRFGEKSRTSEREFAVVPFADSDEKFVGWQFFDLRSHVVLEFEVMFTRGVDAFCFFESIFDAIKEHHGNVVTSYSSPRLTTQKSAVTLTAIFAREYGFDSAAACLKIIRTRPARIDPDAERNTNLPGDTRSRVVRTTPQKDRLMSLGVVESTSARRDEVRKMRSPYVYTRPLEKKRFALIFGTKPKVRRASRLGLVENICETLTGPNYANVAIVGAHRTGKTTTLSLIRDLLKKKDSQRGDIRVVEVNASVTPLFELLTRVTIEVRESLRRDPPDEVDVTKRRQRRQPKTVVTTVPSDGVSLKDLKSSEDLAESVRQHREMRSERAMKLRHARSDLEAALQDLGSNSQCKFVVIVDELADGLRWGDKDSMPVWRDVLESEKFRKLRWVVSSTVSVHEATDYSPISNVFREYNIEPLIVEEARRVVSAMEFVSEADRQNESKSRRGPIVVVDEAQEMLFHATGRLPYLLQVACSAVFENVISLNAAIVTRSLCVSCALDRIVVDLSDYFESEWRRFSPDVQRDILAALNRKYPSRDDVFSRGIDDREAPPQDLAPKTIRALKRSGFWGAYSDDILPRLAVYWLLWEYSPRPEGEGQQNSEERSHHDSTTDRRSSWSR